MKGFDSEDVNKQTPLHKLIIYHKLDDENDDESFVSILNYFIELYRKHFRSINQFDEEDFTPLHYAAMKDDLIAFRHLAGETYVKWRTFLLGFFFSLSLSIIYLSP